MSDPKDAEFNERVFRAELGEIRARREEVQRRGMGAFTPSTPPSDMAEHVGDRPSVTRGLVGLSLSGGGIRSAAFSLGVLQALQSQRILPFVDYLSTVSGGGWIGSCLSALMREPGAEFPFSYEAKDAWWRGVTSSTRNRVLEYLRDRASALVPSGLSGGLGFATRVLRGSLMTLAMMVSALLVPSLVVGALVGAYLKFLSYRAGDVDLHPSHPWTWFIHATPVLLMASVLGLLISPVIRTVVRDPKRLPWLDTLVLRLFTATALAFLFEVHAYVTWRTFNAYRLSGYQFRAFVAANLHTVASALTPGQSARILIVLLVAAGIALRSMLSRAKAAFRVAGLSLIAVVSLAPVYLLHLYFSITLFSVYDRKFAAITHHPTLLPISLLGSALIMLMDTNEASLHGLFRKQIADLFILKPADGGRRYEPSESIPLSSLSQPGSIAPYHIINAALNLQGSTDPSLRGRNSDFFVFTKHFIGGRRTGYIPTPEMEALVPSVDLATAMTTSAAAAAPNMGTYTMRSVVMLMAFLNLRLGFWLRNPARLVREVGKNARTGLGAWFKSFPGGMCYFRELLSDLDERGEHIYLSDGGHIENTGAYELLRRRCRYIIVCDAEEDPTMHFGGLAALIRYARLDLGVEIRMDLSELATVDKELSRRHSLVAQVEYPPIDGKMPETGTLVYLKTSMTGDEHPVIWQYNADNPAFPHESTANQAFGEAQFEAYRALGEHIALGLAGNDFNRYDARGTLDAWFEAVASRVAPSPDFLAQFAGLRDELEEVESLLRAPEAAGYFAELYPEMVTEKTHPEVPPAVLHEVAMRQIHLIASAYTQLRLDSEGAFDHPWNCTWLPIFRRWAESPSFRRVWLMNVLSQGGWSRRFCADRLGLSFMTTWEVATPDEVAARGLALEQPPHPDADGVIHLLCVVESSPAVRQTVGVSRVELKLQGASGVSWMGGHRCRAGLDAHFWSSESQSDHDRLLDDLGIVRKRISDDGAIPAGAPLTDEQIARVKALMVPLARAPEAPAA